MILVMPEQAKSHQIRTLPPERQGRGASRLPFDARFGNLVGSDALSTMWSYQDRFGRPRAGVFAALEVRLSFAPLLTMSLPAPHIPAHPRPRRNRRQAGGQVLATRCSAWRGTSTGSGQNASPARCGQGGCAAHARPQSQELSAMQQHGLPQVPAHLPRTHSAASEDGPLQDVPQPVPPPCEIGHSSPLVPCYGNT